MEVKKITSTQIAEAIGMTRQGFEKTLKEESLKVETLEKIADFFSLPVIAFFDGEKNPATTIQNSCNGLGNTIQIALSDCEKETRHLKEMLAEKEKRISLLERLLDKP